MIELTLKEKECIIDSCGVIGTRLLNIDRFFSTRTRRREFVNGSGKTEVEVFDYRFPTPASIGLNLGYIVKIDYGYDNWVNISDRYSIRSIFAVRTFDGGDMYDESIENNWDFIPDNVRYAHFNAKYIAVNLYDKTNKTTKCVGVLDGKHIVYIPSIYETDNIE